MESTPLIVALGNPGPEYESTRHNFGFLTAEAILAQARERKSAALKTLQPAGDFELYSLVLGGVSCLLCRPLTFMNLSGRAAAKVIGRFSLDPANMLVIHDELDLPLGRMKLKRGGGSNGHKGVDSIVEHTGTAEFLRLRLGIGRPAHPSQVVHYVLEKFSEDEMRAVDAVRQAALKGLALYMRRGMADAVQMLNAYRLPEAVMPKLGMDTPGALE